LTVILCASGKLWNKSANWSLNEHICMPGHRKRACFLSWIACKPHLSHVPSWCFQLLVSTRSAWECYLKRATLRCVCWPKSRCRYLGTGKGGLSTVTDLRGKATQLWYFAALSVWSSSPRWFAWFQILLNLFLTSTTNSDCGIVWNVLTRCWKSPLLSRPCKASKNSALQHFLLIMLIAISALRTLARVQLLLHSRTL